MSRKAILKVNGGNHADRQLIRDATRWALENELILNRKVTINITISKALKDAYGEAVHNAPSSYLSKSFSVRINDETLTDKVLFMETLMHELVHIWQMVNRSTRYKLNSNKSAYAAFWKGKYVDPYKGYSKQPWERQAYYMESKLATKYWESVNQ